MMRRLGGTLGSSPARTFNGPVGVVPLRFDTQTTRFMDLSYRMPEPDAPRGSIWPNYD